MAVSTTQQIDMLLEPGDGSGITPLGNALASSKGREIVDQVAVKTKYLKVPLNVVFRISPQQTELAINSW